MQSIISLANKIHGGTRVYPSKAACMTVLQAVEDARPPWWSPRCSEFLAEAARAPTISSSSGSSSNSSTAPRNPIILLEGLDGVGKTRISQTLAEKLSGTALNTPPPRWADIRACFRDEDESIARAFYGAANYVAADGIQAASEQSIVVVDRWWCSTCAMALANQWPDEALLPAEGDAVYQWPADLLRPTSGYYLHVGEDIRVARIRKRAPEDAEERRLSAQRGMRAAAAEAYRRTHMLTPVPCTTYRAAVNSILLDLDEKGVISRSGGGKYPYTLFTEEELAEVDPF